MSSDPLKCGLTPSYALFMTTPYVNFRKFVPTPRILFGLHRLLIVEKSSNLPLGKIVFSKGCYHFRNFHIDKEGKKYQNDIIAL